ncbi:S-adenosyl-L-methionine-dependent methyltransferase [Aspergillus bertholletiae]|uniref:Ubiquinone biosynthesis O-methyltransferase, mitochondrial n=1 Tax=Aspergillus bertholletiae TaxID=1226010 RepID=A0A5N7ARF7_9EURO|nr:S-adenosyl-L-methionine-dependent methyltransferase [Aspergillus bertholletiae]
MLNTRPTFRKATSLLRYLKSPLRAHSTSVSADELSHFSSLASSWWDPMGPSRVLHLMNPLRHDFIASCLFDSLPPPRASAPGTSTPANNFRYLDVGCGGGIFAESLARTIPTNADSPSQTVTQAASITAIDPTSALIKIARDHARTDPKIEAHLRDGKFAYKNCTLEDVVESLRETPEDEKFDIVTLFEVLEHVDTNAASSPLAFLTNCLRVLRPGGWLVGSTIARTLPSFLVNQVIAEAPWPIGVVPKGTHEWSKFVNPDELHAWAQEGLMRSQDGAALRAGGDMLQGMRWKCSGVMYFPGIGWKLVPGSENWGNYFWAIQKGV